MGVAERAREGEMQEREREGGLIGEERERERQADRQIEVWRRERWECGRRESERGVEERERVYVQYKEVYTTSWHLLCESQRRDVSQRENRSFQVKGKD